MPKIRLYYIKNRPRKLVATFQPEFEHIAEMCVQRCNDMEIEEEKDLQACKPDTHTLHVDLTQATRTHRAIAVSLSEHTLHDNLEIIAYTQRYGTIRGQVDPTDQGRLLFISRLKTIWPNAIIK